MLIKEAFMRYLFCSLPSLGFLGSSIAIAQELRQRGHDVAFVTGVSATAPLQQVHMERIPYGIKDNKSFEMKLIGHPIDLARQVKHIEYALTQFPADVLVGQQLALGAIVAGKRFQLPVAVIGLATYVWPTNQPLSYYDTLDDDRKRLGRYYTSCLASYHICCDMFKIPRKETSYNETTLLGDLFLLQSVPELEDEIDLLPDRLHLVGDCTWNAFEIDVELQQWLEKAVASKRPIIYLQVAHIFTFSNFWEQLAEALGDLDVYVAASIGRADQPITSIPANFLIRDHVPQGYILPHAQAVVCSSTTTSVVGALTHGLPLLLITASTGEQVDLALRCLHAQVALSLTTEEATYNLLAQKIQVLLHDSQLSFNARKMQSAFAATNGSVQAADLIELLATKRCPIVRCAT